MWHKTINSQLSCNRKNVPGRALQIKSLA